MSTQKTPKAPPVVPPMATIPPPPADVATTQPVDTSVDTDPTPDVTVDTSVDAYEETFQDILDRITSGMSRREHVTFATPSNWALEPTEDGLISCRNIQTGHTFEGTMEDFNAIVRSI